MPYPPTIREEELKNKVAANLTPSFDCANIRGMFPRVLLYFLAIWPKTKILSQGCWSPPVW